MTTTKSPPKRKWIIAKFCVLGSQRFQTNKAFCPHRGAFFDKDTVSLIGAYDLAVAVIEEHDLHNKYDVEIVENVF
jgi:hypothetical protein